MALSKGDRLGRFEILDLLGAGGMGEVYRAFDPELEREVAIKVLPSELAADPNRLARLEREARAIGRLQHPSLLAIHDLGRDGGTPYLVFELLEGQTLQRLLEHGPLPVERTLQLVAQIAEGLAAAHAEGIVHRDLKPANLFLTDDGRLKILDFGLAKPTASATDDESQMATMQAVSHDGQIVGTAEYMAPEQAAGRAVDHRADQFALGVVLYEMLTGRRPFSRDTAPETMTAILRKDPEPLGEVAPEVPVPLRWTVERCLQRDPDQRYDSTRDLTRELSTLASALPELATVSPPPPRDAEPRSGRASSRSILPLVLVAASALVLGLSIGALLFPPENDPSTVEYRQITFRRGTVTAARFDPASESVLYSASWEGEPDRLHLYTPQAQDPIVVGPPESRLASISPDGELLLIQNVVSAGPFLTFGGLARMPITGTPRPLAESVAEAVFGPDGEIAAIVREERGEAVLEFPPGSPRLRTAGIVIDPRLSPDGQRLAFAHAPQRGHEWGPIVILDRQEGEQRLQEEAGIGLAWSPTGRELWYVVKRGQNRLAAITPGGETRTLAKFPSQIALLDVAADGRVLLAIQQRRYEMAGRAIEGPERELTWLSWSVPFEITADGESILFNECSGFDFQCRAALRGFGDETPVVLDRNAFAIGISPDQKWIVSIPPWNPEEIVLIATDSDERRELSAAGLERIGLAEWAVDGSGLFVSGNAPGEGARIFFLDLAGGAPTAMTPEGIAFGFFAVSPDGETIAAPLVAGGIGLYSMTGGEPRIIPSTEVPIRWSADGRSLFTSGLSTVQGTLSRIDLSDGSIEPIATLMPPDPAGVVQVSPVSVTPDGRSWIYGYQRQLDELFIVEGLE